MGDVFDAMNRPPQGSPEESPRSEFPESADADGPGGLHGLDDVELPDPDGGLETGGLPLEEVWPEARVQPGKPMHNQQPVYLRLAGSDRVLPSTADPGPDFATQKGSLLPGGEPDVSSHRNRTGLICEQYRQLRAQILARSKQRRRQTRLFTSAEPREGKTLTVVNLGVVFAELADSTTLLIEADLRRPSFQRVFGRPFIIGLTHVLRGDVEDEAEAIHPTVYPNLHVMPAGEHDDAQAGELLAGSTMVRLLDCLKDRYDHILIDSPPVVHTADACVLGALCDETVLVVRMHRTPRKSVRRARQLLEAAGCTMAGSILVGARDDQQPQHLFEEDDA